MRENSRSFEYADTLPRCVTSVIPVTSGVAVTLRRKGPRVKTKSNGDSGRPCLNLFVMEKGLGIIQLTLT